MTDSTVRFSNRVDDYAQYRPSYPPEAIAAVLDGFSNPVVADLGAGTGISARLLAEAGAFVFAVEPNANMRSAMPSNDRIVAVNGTSESTGLEPLTIDIVTAFQAYHWFQPQRTFAEVDRISRRRARFAAVWNERDDQDPFTGRYGEITRRYMTDDTEDRRRNCCVDRDIEAFGWGRARVLEFRYSQSMTLDAFIGRARSSSYLPREGPAYEAMAAELRALFDSAQVYGTVRFVYVTAVHLGKRQ